MPTLTADEITEYRQQAGDDCTPNVISDARIQAFYDRAYAANSDDADLTEATTMVYILRRLWGLTRTKIDMSSEMQNEYKKNSQLPENTEKLLKYWEGLAGMGGGGVLAIGALDLDIDYTEDDLEAEA